MEDPALLRIRQNIVRRHVRKQMETVTFRHWKDFRDYVHAHSYACPIYWRGQKDPEWPIASSFERKILELNGGWMDGASKVYPYATSLHPNGRYKIDGKKTWEEGFIQTYRDAYIRNFEKASSGLRGSAPEKIDRDQWWALGRHHGLITPLLDWTEKPFIAAFFALSELWIEMSSKGGGIAFDGKEVAVYKLIHNKDLEGDGLRVVAPKVEELGRMHGQRGLFTWLDSEEYFELEGFVNNTGREKLLTQIILSDQTIMEGLKDFDSYGIDYRMLFPDLAGAALHANARINWNII